MPAYHMTLRLSTTMLYYSYFHYFTGMDSSPTLPETNRCGKKIFVIALTSFVTVIVLIFAIFFVYYLWQMKYGPLEKQTKTAEQFHQARFTFAGNSQAVGPRVSGNLNQYIRSNNPRIGNKEAKVTIMAFIDFQCPFSQDGYPLFKEIMNKYGPATQVVIKYFPLIVIHPEAMDAANASACAGAQGKFWEYYDKLFTIKKFDSASFQQYAKELNLDEKKFTSCLTTKPYQKDIDQDVLDAATLGIRGTPTYFVNQTPIEGVVDIKTWDNVILNNLK